MNTIEAIYDSCELQAILDRNNKSELYDTLADYLNVTLVQVDKV